MKQLQKKAEYDKKIPAGANCEAHTQKKVCLNKTSFLEIDEDLVESNKFWVVQQNAN